LLPFNHNVCILFPVFRDKKNWAGVSPAQRPFVELFLFICPFSSDRVQLSGPNGDTMKSENMSEAELDARLKALLEKYQQEKRR
jgi:hypothetical protein